MHPAVFHNLFSCEVYRPCGQVVVVVHDAWKNISPPARELLSRILHSVEHSLGHVRIFEQPQLNVAALPVRPARLVAFTRAPEGIPLYEPLTTPDGVMVVAAPLTALLTHDDQKKRLWQALKVQFAR